MIASFRYDKPVTISSVTGKYDAGATVSFMDQNKKNLASKNCYDSNGGKENTCALTFSKTTGTKFYLRIDSKHSTWNWMGKWEIEDNCAKGGSDAVSFSDTANCKPKVTMEQDGKQHSSSTNHGGHQVSTGGGHDLTCGWRNTCARGSVDYI